MKRRERFNAATKALTVSFEFEHPARPGRPVHASAMARLLGVRGSYPSRGLPARNVQGVRVWVRPLPPHVPGTAKRSAHRAWCSCPGCGRELSAGRLFQHVCTALPEYEQRDAELADLRDTDPPPGVGA